MLFSWLCLFHCIPHDISMICISILSGEIRGQRGRQTWNMAVGKKMLLQPMILNIVHTCQFPLWNVSCNPCQWHLLLNGRTPPILLPYYFHFRTPVKSLKMQQPVPEKLDHIYLIPRGPQGMGPLEPSPGPRCREWIQ